MGGELVNIHELTIYPFYDFVKPVNFDWNILYVRITDRTAVLRWEVARARKIAMSALPG